MYSKKEFLKYAEQALYIIFLVLVFHACIHYYCNNSGMIFITVHIYPKGLLIWVCQPNGEFEWYRKRLLGGTANVCECLLLERGIIMSVFPLFN